MTEDDARLLDLVAELLHVTSVNVHPRNLSVDALVGALLTHLSAMPPQSRDSVLRVLGTNFVSVADVPLEFRLHGAHARWH
jgi:hypothetical protein